MLKAIFFFFRNLIVVMFPVIKSLEANHCQSLNLIYTWISIFWGAFLWFIFQGVGVGGRGGFEEAFTWSVIYFVFFSMCACMEFLSLNHIAWKSECSWVCSCITALPCWNTYIHINSTVPVNDKLFHSCWLQDHELFAAGKLHFRAQTTYIE
jgi:hypothetical protein